MHIFRSTLAAAMLILTLATTAAAQTKERKAAYVPKHEVTISGAVGYNSFLSSRQDGLPLHQDSFFDEFSASILFFPIEIGYTFHIDKHWGVSTGIGLQAHGGIYGNTGTHYIYQSGTRPLPVSPTDPPASFAQTSTYATAYTFRNEDHSLTAVYASIPILGQYMLPFANEKWNFYVQAGLKLGIFVHGEVFSQIGSDITYRNMGIYQYNGQLGTMPGDAKERSITSGGRPTVDKEAPQSVFRKVNLYGSLETGIRIPIWRFIGMYVGGYVDLGLLRAVNPWGGVLYSSGNELEAPLFTAFGEGASITNTDTEYTVLRDTKPYLKGVLPISAGLKIKLAL